MKLVLKKSIGELKASIYQYGLGYGYKIKLNGVEIGRSYAYIKDLEHCKELMENELKYLSGFDKTLFDLENIK